MEITKKEIIINVPCIKCIHCTFTNATKIACDIAGLIDKTDIVECIEINGCCDDYQETDY